MANALVVHNDRLPQSQKMHRAAQYVRMSTDYQQYSIQNQAVVIATYAELHKLTIVGTYRDEGESGLKIENRSGLTVSPLTFTAVAWQYGQISAVTSDAPS
jgi:hypothetical protein